MSLAEELCAEAACHPRLGGVGKADGGRGAQQFFSHKTFAIADSNHRTQAEWACTFTGDGQLPLPRNDPGKLCFDSKN